MAKVLVTGGAGYIGTHTLVELLAAGHEPIVIDNLVNSSAESLKRVAKISGQEVAFYKFDLCDSEKLNDLCGAENFDAVIHFAGLKAVGESVAKPLEYYQNNLQSTLTLLAAMEKHHIPSLIFSSSATVYGDPSELPLKETSRVGVGLTNPYGKTKYFIEEILRDWSAAHPDKQVTILRYFNPIGAHPSGLIGEDPQGPPNNLLPYVAQVAVGQRQEVTVHGNDYNTPDGTGVRDYIHVVDLARGHVAALDNLQPGVSTYNLGTGQGSSVLEVIAAFSKACGRNVPYVVGPRRPGDLGSCYASADLAADKLKWRATKTLADACADAWRWQSANPHGFADTPK